MEVRNKLFLEVKNSKVDAFYFTNFENLEYLTGFKGTYGVCIVTNKNIYLATDDRYFEEAKNDCKETTVINVSSRSWTDLMTSFNKLAYEGRNMTIERLKKLQQKYKNIQWVECYPIIEQFRREKNQFELIALSKASEITSSVLNKFIHTIKDGQTEIELSWNLEKRLRDEVCEQLAFPIIIAFEENSAVPHHIPNNKRALKKGDTILIDVGIQYHGYCADMTRTYFYKEITSYKEQIYKHVLNAQQSAIKMVKDSESCSKLFYLVMDYFNKNNLGQYFTHSLGHGIGLEPHEMPILSSMSKEHLIENDTITIEPGLYIPGQFGVRIEDMGVVTKEGFKNYTLVKKDLAIIN